jgi:hypothetical protein
MHTGPGILPDRAFGLFHMLHPASEIVRIRQRQGGEDRPFFFGAQRLYC